MRAFWKKLQKEPVYMRRAQGWLTLLWVAMIPLSLLTGWVRSVTFVSALSLWALVASHGAWAASSLECRQAEENLAVDVVEKMVEKTDIEQAPA
jgi:hypothetical protein